MAERSLAGPDDLQKAVTALISLPPATVPAMTTTPMAVDVAPAIDDRDRIATPAPRHVSDRRLMGAGFDLGLGPVTRIGYDSRTAIAAGVASFAQVRADGWLVGLTGRAASTINRSGATLENAVERTYAFGITLGRRVTYGTLDLDFLAETALEMERFSFVGSSSVLDGDADDVNQPRPNDTGQQTVSSEKSFSTDSVSAGLVLRASVPLSPGLRGYAALDADRVLSRFAVSNTAPTGTPIFPVWSAGLSFGLAWSPL
jgi:hypothetical protein